MDDYLSKPIVNEELDRVLRAWSLTARSGAYETVRPGARASSMPAAAPPATLAPPRATPARATPAPPAPPADEGVPPSGPALAPPAQRAGEPDVLAQVTRLLLTEAPERVGAMRAAVGRGDLSELERLARELHEAAEALGVLYLQNLAARLERQARAGTVESAGEAVRAIDQEIERARLALSVPRRRGPT
jgi:HPt (histidine-containing phosphotransfer) domain-containing protein